MIWKFYAKLIMHAPMWTLKCRKSFGHVMLGLRIHFLYFSQPCVSKIFSFINLRIHLSLVLSVQENSHNVHPSGVYTFFQKLVMISEFFFKEKFGSYLFSQACWFFSQTTYFFSLSFFFFFHELFCYLNICIFL